MPAVENISSSGFAPRRLKSNTIHAATSIRESRGPASSLAQVATMSLSGGVPPSEEAPPSGSAMFKQNNFSQELPEYKFGNWGNRFYFLPTIPRSEESPLVVKTLKELTEAGDLEGMKILLHSGVSANLVVDPLRHRTPLHIAASREDVLMSQLLLRFHADPHVRDGSLDGPTPEKMGWSAADIAKARECLSLVSFFSLEVSNGRPPEGVSGRLSVGLEPQRTRTTPRGTKLRQPSASLDRPIRLDLHPTEPGFMRRDP